MHSYSLCLCMHARPGRLSSTLATPTSAATTSCGGNSRSQVKTNTAE